MSPWGLCVLCSEPTCQPLSRDRMTEKGDSEGTSGVPRPLLASSELLGVPVGQGGRGIRGFSQTGSTLISVCPV